MRAGMAMMIANWSIRIAVRSVALIIDRNRERRRVIVVLAIQSMAIRAPSQDRAEHQQRQQMTDQHLHYRKNIAQAHITQRDDACYPAQHESSLTSLVNVCAASLMPSTMVRYGNRRFASSSTVIRLWIASTAV